MQKATKSNNYLYNKNLQPRANELRKNMTKGEAYLWKFLLGKSNMKGYKFKRQRPVLNYIADFMCTDLLLIIEVDGISHWSEEAVEKDRIREDNLKSVGFSILRFSDWEVLNRIGAVSEEISNWIDENAMCPPPEGRKERKRRD